MTLMFLTTYAVLFVVDLLLALVAVARVLPVARRAGGVLAVAALSAALTVVGVVLADVGGFAVLTLRTSQGPEADVWFLLGYGAGALLLVQAVPLVHAGAMATAGFTLLSMTGSAPDPTEVAAR